MLLRVNFILVTTSYTCLDSAWPWPERRQNRSSITWISIPLFPKLLNRLCFPVIFLLSRYRMIFPQR